MPKTTIDDWINVPALMETPFKKFEGVVKHGIRMPIAPATTPLKECPPDAKEEINGEKPRYWFVDPQQTIKVRLLSHEVSEDNITGEAYDFERFKYTIRRI